MDYDLLTANIYIFSTACNQILKKYWNIADNVLR